METFCWIVLILLFVFLWLKGHWYAWLVIWATLSVAYCFVISGGPSGKSGSVFIQAVVIGCVTSIPMLIKVLINLRRAGLKSVDDLYYKALTDPVLAKQLIANLPEKSKSASFPLVKQEAKSKIEPHF